ncbi:MAG: branched-chain amino acid transaminase [Bacteroidetes bacterium]|nr:branched-chain amino acid transaminase [Bacteroidota bacterium]MCW5894174.1 branched-chain amino acid transaminase [Bacteroidota bacterium]
MPVKEVEKIWMNGKLVNWHDAKIHVLSHVIHYGSSWFEGIRCYQTAKGPAIFRLDKHIRRLLDSTKIYKTECPYNEAEIEEAILQTIRANKMKECYIRPVVYRGYGDVGVNPLPCPVDVTIAVWEWGSYLGPQALTDGIDVCVSTWTRPAPNTLPTMAKAGGNYALSQIMKVEAIQAGFKEAIALDVHGYVSEGSGENIFLVKDNVILTPPICSSLLPGITRSSIIQIAGDAGYVVKETNIPREMLYIADELFFTGTAAEVTPIRSVDKLKVADGKPGRITMQLQEKYFDVVKNANDPYNWLKYVYND